VKQFRVEIEKTVRAVAYVTASSRARAAKLIADGEWHETCAEEVMSSEVIGPIVEIFEE